jgi:hypothetical protein
MTCRQVPAGRLTWRQLTFAGKDLRAVILDDAPMNTGVARFVTTSFVVSAGGPERHSPREV